MITEGAIRKLALALPEAVESSHFNVVDFRVRGKIFATIHPGAKTGVLLRIDPDQRAALADAQPEIYQLRGTALQVTFDRIDAATYQQLLTEAWRGTAPKRVVAAAAAEMRAPSPPRPRATAKPSTARPRARARPAAGRARRA